MRRATERAITKCSQEIERLPLEAFRLPTDGRKWKQSARSRCGLLLRLSVKANPDGTFIGPHGQNFSPSFERLSKHVSRGSYTRLTNDLRELGLLSWIREKHYDRRAYTIHLPEHSQDSPKHYPDSESELAKDGKNQYPDSPESVSRLVNETPNHYPDSSKSLSTMVRIPSFPTKERADKGIPTPEPNQKPETASLAPSAKIKTDFTGAGKESQKQTAPAQLWNRQTKHCRNCGDEFFIGMVCPSCRHVQ